MYSTRVHQPSLALGGVCCSVSAALVIHKFMRIAAIFSLLITGLSTDTLQLSCDSSCLSYNWSG